jgi:hypothetical protein
VTTSYVEYFDDKVVPTPWKSTSGWIRNDQDPGCYFRHLRRTVTWSWTQRTVTLVWGPWRCPRGWTLRSDRCWRSKYEPIRDSQGWPTSKSELVHESAPAERSRQWSYGPLEEHSETWEESRFQVWRIPSADDIAQIVDLPMASVYLGDAVVPLPDMSILEVSVDGNPLEVHDEVLVSGFEAGIHDVSLTVDLDGQTTAAEFMVQVISRLRFGVPSVAVNDEEEMHLSVPLTNESAGEVGVRIDIPGKPRGWWVRTNNARHIRIPPHETVHVEVNGVRLVASNPGEHAETCTVSATVVTDPLDWVSVTAPLPRQHAASQRTQREAP